MHCRPFFATRVRQIFSVRVFFSDQFCITFKWLHCFGYLRVNRDILARPTCMGVSHSSSLPVSTLSSGRQTFCAKTARVRITNTKIRTILQSTISKNFQIKYPVSKCCFFATYVLCNNEIKELLDRWVPRDQISFSFPEAAILLASAADRVSVLHIW